MFYRGERNVPGAAGNLLAGNPFSSSFVIPQQTRSEADRLFRQGMDNTESGRKIKENMQRVRQMLPQAMGGASPVGNLSGLVAQINPNIPPGYMNKIVS